MTHKKDNPKGLKKKKDAGVETRSANDPPVNPEEASFAKNDSDIEPDEFLGPNADTDTPVDGQVLNDAVLRGEPHVDNVPMPDKPKT